MCANSALDSYANLIENNDVRGGSTGVVVGGGGRSHGNDGPWNVIRNNRFMEQLQNGVRINDHSHDAIVESNQISDAGAESIHVTESCERTRLWNNRIQGWGVSGIAISEDADTEVFGNFLRGDDPVVQIEDSRDYQVRGNDLGGGTIEHPGTGMVEE